MKHASLLPAFMAVIVSACGGASGTSPAPGGANPHSQSARHTDGGPRLDVSGCGQTVIYVVSSNNRIEVFNRLPPHSRPCGAIKGLIAPSNGLFVDAQNDLWVGYYNSYQHSQILEFAPGNPSPVLTLDDSIGLPLGVAVDNATGTVYVANEFNYSNMRGAVEVYPKGSTTPAATLTDPNMQDAFDPAVDNQGNLYVTFDEHGGVGQVDEWFGGAGAPKNLGITLSGPAALVTSASGALVVCDLNARVCGDFAPDSKTMTNTFGTTEKLPYAIAFDKDEDRAYVESVHRSFGIWAYPGPDSRELENVIVPGGSGIGLAVSPAAPEGPPY